MNRQLFVICLFFLFPAALFSKNPDQGFPKSCEVHSDGSVTFRFIADSAESVVIKSGVLPKNKAGMVRGENNWWEFTTEPAEPGIYDYSFLVDGVLTLDPHNRWIKGWRRSANMLEIPSDPPGIWQFSDVPHGVIHHHHFYSDVLKAKREVFVYTPPGYDEKSKKLPVLFLLHGSGDDASAWTNVGRVHFIADNLIAAGKMKPMVIVMPYGHATMPGVAPETLTEGDSWYLNNDNSVMADFFETLLPFAQKSYRISEDPEMRAITGLSMGGSQALSFGLNHPEQFRWVGGFSSGVPGDADKVTARYPTFDPSADFKLVWIACGKNDFLLDRNNFFHGWLDQKGLKHTYKLTEGGHSWPVWRNYIEEFLPLLFTDMPSQ